jgi:hypothetical protein
MVMRASKAASLRQQRQLTLLVAAVRACPQIVEMWSASHLHHVHRPADFFSFVSGCSESPSFAFFDLFRLFF